MSTFLRPYYSLVDALATVILAILYHDLSWTGFLFGLPLVFLAAFATARYEGKH